MSSLNQNLVSPWVKKSLSFLIWMSPLFSLGIFFPLGVLFAFPRTISLRKKAISVIWIYFFTWIVFFPVEMFHRSSLDAEALINEFLKDESTAGAIKGAFVLFIGILLFINYVHSSSRQSTRKKIRLDRLAISSPGTKLRNHRVIRDTKFDTYLLVFFLGLFLSFGFQLLIEKINPMSPHNPMAALAGIYQFVFNYLLSTTILLFTFNKSKIPSLISPLFLKYQTGIRLRETWKVRSEKREKFSFLKEMEVKKRAVFRERLLPGMGHVYLYDFWRGFPFLFVGLLLWLFLAVWSFSFFSPVFGIQFLGSMGLKPGIPDKDFFIAAQNIGYLAITVMALTFTYVYSSSLLGKNFTLENLGYRKGSDLEREPIFVSGLRKGFRNTLPISILFHLIILSLVFIIPISIQRNSSKKNNSADKTKHFQPDKMEFYFIDPNIPDDTKGLNGGVITGTDTTNKEQGEKISNEKTADNGPKAGYVKKIRGKKVPPTYSNYISAKMRIPESYMEYWAKAPHPYSSVVAYTITQDGDIIDIELIEGSNYPDQDRLTLELIESLAPMIPPPNTEGDIRVTELFWNGPIDPNSVPTPLQKEMVHMFDGRYMEEVPE
ncbi:energy transducer TonB [Leptospira ognonensis]|uniref:Energy transducer TonB n=1 Tax=Leptospira ognonensis TaxID=2484945 RepID=A0A4R9K0V6_9LEPT|nr:energy transducer TonB [Leptospira ognonensis]TGL59283.1 energy transducer TonB [Leptospira ognonensis]